MALIELTSDDLCAMASSPFPCEEGKIIDPIGTAHWLGLVETGPGLFEDAPTTASPASRTVDRRLVMLSLACSMEASQAVTQARPDTQASLDAFVDGAIASPPEMTTVFPPSGTVIVVGTVIIKIPTPPPVPPRWEPGELLGRTDLLSLATKFLSASKMPGIGANAGYLAGAADRLIDAAVKR